MSPRLDGAGQPAIQAAEADSLLARQTRAAEEAAARIVESAKSQAAELVDKARADADVIRAAAQQERAMTIDGANTTRERILDDLSRRRRVASVQIEQLRAGRERLLESYAVVRRTLEEVNNSLNRADAEARAAADEVGRRMQREQPARHEARRGDPAASPVANPQPLRLATPRRRRGRPRWRTRRHWDAGEPRRH